MDGKKLGYSIVQDVQVHEQPTIWWRLKKGLAPPFSLSSIAFPVSDTFAFLTPLPLRNSLGQSFPPPLLCSDLRFPKISGCLGPSSNSGHCNGCMYVCMYVCTSTPEMQFHCQNTSPRPNQMVRLRELIVVRWSLWIGCYGSVAVDWSLWIGGSCGLLALCHLLRWLVTLCCALWFGCCVGWVVWFGCCTRMVQKEYVLTYPGWWWQHYH